jgi:hypothetical protein
MESAESGSLWFLRLDQDETTNEVLFCELWWSIFSSPVTGQIFSS